METEEGRRKKVERTGKVNEGQSGGRDEGEEEEVGERDKRW